MTFRLLFSWMDGMDEAELFQDCGSSVMVVSEGSLLTLTLLCLWWWCDFEQFLDEDRLLFRMKALFEILLIRFGGGDGVDIRLAYCKGMISAPGPTRLSRIGKKNRPLMAPMTSTDSNSQKKCRTTNSNDEVDSIRTASIEVMTAWMTGASECSSASLIRRSRLPIAVMKPCGE